MELKVKICGMKSHENMMDVVAMKPDYMGFIFYRKSPRYVGDDFQVPQSLIENESINLVGVFVNEKKDSVLKLCQRLKLDFVQLHGNEDVEYCQYLQETGLRIIKVFRVEDRLPITEMEKYKGVVDYFLFDTKTELYGGSGKTFNWEILNGYNFSLPYFLSGGIGSKDIKMISEMKLSNLHAIDVNSKVEDKPGVKNIKLVEELMVELN